MSRSGFVALAGRPNSGKSTLVNWIVGDKVAIVSDKPQTTRREIRGVATGDGWQLVLVDLPGVQRPRDALTERMQRQVERALADADAALFVLNGEQEIGPGDRFIAEALKRAGVGEVVEQLVSLLPEGPFMYPPDERSDQSLELQLAELIREQVLRRTRDEIPHAVEVEVESIEAREDGIVAIKADVWAESQSQKAILIGKGGRMVREVGTAARRELERELESKVFLDLRVRVREHWRRDESLLDRLGID